MQSEVEAEPGACPLSKATHTLAPDKAVPLEGCGSSRGPGKACARDRCGGWENRGSGGAELWPLLCFPSCMRPPDHRVGERAGGFKSL